MAGHAVGAGGRVAIKTMNYFKTAVIFSVITLGSARAEPSVTVQSKIYASGTVVNEWAQYTLSTAGTVTVKNGANVSFSAGSGITLYPGFSVEAGGLFNATASYSPPYNPGGYYIGITPTLNLVSGDQQYGQVGQFNLLPFDIAIWNTAGTAPLVNAPVLITVNAGGGWLSLTNDANAVLTKTLNLTTDADGTIHAYYQQGTSVSVVSSIQVVAGNQTWQFTTTSYEANGTNPDIDADGIYDTAEAALGLNSTQPTQTSTALGLMVFTP